MVKGGREGVLFNASGTRVWDIWRLVQQKNNSEASMSLYLQGCRTCRLEKNVLSMICYKMLHLV